MSLPAVFDYHPAKSVDEAIALLQQYGDDAKLLAGGHSLLPTMKLRLAQPAHLVDIGKIGGLSYIREENGAFAVGAMTTYTTIERSEVLSRHFALLPEGISVIGDPQVRNRGTIGGSIAHSDPAADMPGIVLALKADILVQGPNGVRTIKADDFFKGMFETALQPDEIITEIRFATPRCSYWQRIYEAREQGFTLCAGWLRGSRFPWWRWHLLLRQPGHNRSISESYPCQRGRGRPCGEETRREHCGGCHSTCR